MSLAPDHDTLAKPETLLRVPVGLTSPLWGLFAGAAVSGAAWWWMTRWTRPQNLEAMFGATAEAPPVAEPGIVAIAQPVVDIVEPVVEATLAPVVEAEAIVEAMAEPAPAPAPEPILEAAPEPEPELAAAATAAEIVEPVVETTFAPVADAEPVVEAAAEVIRELVAEPVLEATLAPTPKAKKKAAEPKAD